MSELKDTVKWGYPKSLEEALSFFKAGYTPHGGGTTLVRSGLASVYGLFNVSEIPEMRRFSITKEGMVLGAGLTYSEVVERISQFDSEHILVKALSHAASNPLRNRITMGGSINVFPYWSDAVGPLIALGARLQLLDRNGKNSTVSVEEYVHNRELHTEYFIVSVDFNTENCKIGNCRSFYYREVRTHFDYPFFTVSILYYPPSEVHVIVTGVKGRYKRLFLLEDFFANVLSEFRSGENKGFDWLAKSYGEKFSKLKNKIGNKIDAEFVNRQGVSAEYQKHVAGVVVRRGVWQILLASKEER